MPQYNWHWRRRADIILHLYNNNKLSHNHKRAHRPEPTHISCNKALALTW